MFGTPRLVEARISALGLPGQRERLLDAGDELRGAFASLPRTINVYNDRENRVTKAIVTACLARLRPIVMTALTTILGVMPIILSRDPLFYDMAVTIAVGLAFATVLTLGLAPVLYATVLRVPSPPRS